MKFGIITINDNNNYGNRLQNYAVQEILKEYSPKVITIKNKVNTNKENQYIIEKMKIVKGIIVNIKKLLKRKWQHNKIEEERSKRFQEFNEYIQFSKGTITYHNAKKYVKNYDFFMVGSDQVWNPNFQRLSEIDLLTFSPKEKNIAFSASFGVSEIEEQKQQNCRNAFQNLKKISVREDAGKKIIEELTHRQDIEVLIDPTMMLNEEDWSKVAKKPKQLKSVKYILNYFLGKMPEERKREIDRIAAQNHCEVINILDRNSEFYGTGPSELLYLEKNAFLVCTDSFHACVFAILFNRPFIVFDRKENLKSMNSRIETLLSKFKLEERKGKDIQIDEKMLKWNYETTYQILEVEREKVRQFLNKALAI